MALSPDQKNNIESLIAKDRVVLFMKGTREQPQCGFSATVVGILNELLPSFTTVNVLADPAIRDGIKEYSSWPTIPQLYVEKEFIGGCDIVREMHANGDIFDALKIQKPSAIAPQIHITPAAIDAFKTALEDASEGEFLRLQIDARFENNLNFGPKNMGDLEIVQDGVLLLIDAISATRAQGLIIDFTSSAQGSGFEVNNPNAPPAVKQMSAKDLKNKFDRGDAFHLFDVRTHDEWQTARISGAKLFIDVPTHEIDALDKDATIVFHCHGGGRSQKMAEQFRKKGFRNLFNLAGGIRAWSTDVDPSVPMY